MVSDVNMPGLDGFALCKKLRESGNRVPLVLLTSRDDEIDEALGLELGADDYVAKPFSTRVLLARISALLRREAMRRAEEPERAIAKGSLELFPERLEVRYAGSSVVVTVTEFRLTCTGNKHTPPLTIFVGDKRAMTCFSGVCYLLAPS